MYSREIHLQKNLQENVSKNSIDNSPNWKILQYLTAVEWIPKSDSQTLEYHTVMKNCIQL